MAQSASRLTITMVTVKAWAMTFLIVPRRELVTRMLSACCWPRTGSSRAVVIRRSCSLAGCPGSREESFERGKPGDSLQRAFLWAFEKRNLPFMARSLFEISAFSCERVRRCENVQKLICRGCLSWSSAAAAAVVRIRLYPRMVVQSSLRTISGDSAAHVPEILACLMDRMSSSEFQRKP